MNPDLGRIPREPRKFPLMSRLIDKPAPLPTEVCSDWSGTEAFAPSQARDRGVRAIPGSQGPRRPHHPGTSTAGSNVVPRTRDARRQLGHQIGHRKHCAFRTFWHWSGRRSNTVQPIQSQGAHHPTPSLVQHDRALAPEGAEINPCGRERHEAKLQSPGPRDLLLQRERRSSRGGETAEWRFALDHELEEA